MPASLCHLISIHAPTRGATSPVGAMFVGNNISIHAPTRGATHSKSLNDFKAIFQSTLPREERPTTWQLTLVLYNFNPRSHERSDDIFMLYDKNYSISIHAPTRGATLVMLILSRFRIFQSTLPREERLLQ